MNMAGHVCYACASVDTTLIGRTEIAPPGGCKKDHAVPCLKLELANCRLRGDLYASGAQIPVKNMVKVQALPATSLAKGRSPTCVTESQSRAMLLELQAKSVAFAHSST